MTIRREPPLVVMLAVLAAAIAGCGGGAGQSAGPIAVAPQTPSAVASASGGTGVVASPGSTTSASGAGPASTASAAAASPAQTASPLAAAASPAATASPSPTASPAAASPAAAATGYAPLAQAGPPLSVPAATLAASLYCPQSIAGTTATPVLLVPGTDTNPAVDFRWNYERQFTALGIPWCDVTLPVSATGDIQIAGEYLVSAIRTMSAVANRKIDILGWSQGGMVPRWALRFWPDTRADVVALVALDPSNHGTLTADGLVATTPANQQQKSTAAFIAALNSYAETFAGIAYTNVYSRTDEVVTPNLDATGSSSLHTGTGAIANVAAQDVCPADASEHLAMGTYDAVGYALAIDAFTHAGVASAARIPATVCAMPYQPGVDPTTFAQNFSALDAYIANAQGTSPMTGTEPPLMPYVFAR